jgi:hypothetical protein
MTYDRLVNSSLSRDSGGSLDNTASVLASSANGRYWRHHHTTIAKQQQKDDGNQNDNHLKN